MTTTVRLTGRRKEGGRPFNVARAAGRFRNRPASLQRFRHKRVLAQGRRGCSRSSEYRHTSGSGCPLTAYTGTLPALPGRTTLNRTTDRADNPVPRRNETGPFGPITAHLHTFALAVSRRNNADASREVRRGLLPDGEEKALSPYLLCAKMRRSVKRVFRKLG